MRLIVVVCAMLYMHCGLAIAQLASPDISNKVQFTFDKLESPGKNCATKSNHTKIACGDQYIYPVLSGHPDPAIQRKINAHILGLAPEAVDDSVRVEASTEIRLNKNNLLSLSHSSDAYGVRAAGKESRLMCSNINLETGEFITLKNILRPGFETALPRLIRKNLDTTLKSRIPGYVASSIRARGGQWKLSRDQPFYLNDRVLVLCFSKFTLSDQSITTLQIPLAYELIDRQIDKKGPLASMLRAVETERKKYSINKDYNFSYSCSSADLTRKITVVENGPKGQYICHVESVTGNKVSVLWRSKQDREYCRLKAQKLVDRYKNEWQWACEKKS